MEGEGSRLGILVGEATSCDLRGCLNVDDLQPLLSPLNPQPSTLNPQPSTLNPLVFLWDAGRVEGRAQAREGGGVIQRRRQICWKFLEWAIPRQGKVYLARGNPL